MIFWRRKLYKGWEVDFIKERKGSNYLLTIRMPDGNLYKERYATGVGWLVDAKVVAKRLIRQKVEWMREDSQGDLVKKTVRF